MDIEKTTFVIRKLISSLQFKDAEFLCNLLFVENANEEGIICLLATCMIHTREYNLLKPHLIKFLQKDECESVVYFAAYCCNALDLVEEALFYVQKLKFKESKCKHRKSFRLIISLFFISCRIKCHAFTCW